MSVVRFHPPPLTAGDMVSRVVRTVLERVRFLINGISSSIEAVELQFIHPSILAFDPELLSVIWSHTACHHVSGQ